MSTASLRSADKTLTGVSNLVKLLPTTTFLAFQTLNPNFSNRGQCLSSNRYLSSILIAVCSIACAFFSITDSFVTSNGKVYYGFATLRGFNVINPDDGDDKEWLAENKRKFRLRISDGVHIVLTVVVFLSLVFSDSYVESCFFAGVSGGNRSQLLSNLPLGCGFLASLVFVLMPHTRKGIGYSTGTTSLETPTITDKTFSGLGNLVVLLPTTTLLAFQTLNPNFSNRGQCFEANKYLSSTLIIICSISCAFFSVTDSVIYKAKLYFGVATVKGFVLFNTDDDDDTDDDTKWLKKYCQDNYKLRLSDAIHVVFTVVVFLSLSFSDANVQNCFFSRAGRNGRQLLSNLPLGLGFLASVVFLLMPNTRKGIGYSDGATTVDPPPPPPPPPQEEMRVVVQR